MATLNNRVVARLLPLLFCTIVVLMVFYYTSKVETLTDSIMKPIRHASRQDSDVTGDVIPSLEKNIPDRQTANGKQTKSVAMGTNCDCERHGSRAFGICFCHPGYTGNGCCNKLPPVEGWMAENCTNLKQDVTYRKDMEYKISVRCFTHPVSGIIRVPTFMWKHAQLAEGHTWENLQTEPGDRFLEHIEGFQGYRGVPKNLGNLVEIGAGPFTQTLYMVKSRRRLNIDHVTLVEPMAERYMKHVTGCTYSDGKLLNFSTTIVAKSGEEFLRSEHFDTVISMNVIEHVQDALVFLQNIYDSIKDGGVLIWHERYYLKPEAADCTLGTYILHPIRITKYVVEAFLRLFQPLFLNTRQTFGMFMRGCNETAVYFVGRKRRLKSDVS